MRLPLLLLLLLLFAPAARAQSVAVDIGHYDEAPGATSARGRAEFEFNRDLARDIAAALASSGRAVRLIGEDGGMRRLTDRSRAARGAALLLSVHHDSVQPHFLELWAEGGVQRLFSDRYAGYSLFISGKNPQPERSLFCASAIGAALREAGFVHSPHHAERIAGEMKRYADRRNGVHFYDNLVVLKTARQPALLIEAGVIVNRAEELRAADPQVRLSFAQAVVRGVNGCLPKSAAPGGLRFDRPAD
jgi:N-acetylmuramoyl-L-alanine amidase